MNNVNWNFVKVKTEIGQFHMQNQTQPAIRVIVLVIYKPRYTIAMFVSLYIKRTQHTWYTIKILVSNIVDIS